MCYFSRIKEDTYAFYFSRSKACKDADLVGVLELLGQHAQLVLGSEHFVELSLLAVFVVEKPLGSLVLDTVTGESVDDQVVFLWALLPPSDQFPENLHVELLGLRF